MKRLLLFALLLVAVPGWAQQATGVAPDCVGPTFNFTATGVTTPFTNTGAVCTTWLVTYRTTGFSAVSLELQYGLETSPGQSGTLTTFPGTSAGTSTSGGYFFGTGFEPFVAVRLVSKTGSGRVTGNFVGWRPGALGAATTSGGDAITGTKSNNAVIPGSTNLGTLPAVANAAAPALTETYQNTLSVDLHGNTRIRIQDSAGNDRGANVTAANELLVNVNNLVANTANDAPFTEAPTGIGGIYQTAPTAVGTAGDKTTLRLTATGEIMPAYLGPIQNGLISSAMTGTTSTAVTGMGVTASNYNYITWCVTSNGSTTVSTDMALQDGNGGTTFAILPAPAASVVTTGGGGGSYQFNPPLKQPTVATALYAVNVTTGASTKLTCGGYRSTVSY